jgi:hypothetical protein
MPSASSGSLEYSFNQRILLNPFSPIFLQLLLILLAGQESFRQRPNSVQRKFQFAIGSEMFPLVLLTQLTKRVCIWNFYRRGVIKC